MPDLNEKWSFSVRTRSDTVSVRIIVPADSVHKPDEPIDLKGHEAREAFQLFAKGYVDGALERARDRRMAKEGLPSIDQLRAEIANLEDLIAKKPGTTPEEVVEGPNQLSRRIDLLRKHWQLSMQEAHGLLDETAAQANRVLSAVGGAARARVAIEAFVKQTLTEEDDLETSLRARLGTLLWDLYQGRLFDPKAGSFVWARLKHSMGDSLHSRSSDANFNGQRKWEDHRFPAAAFDADDWKVVP